jgi:uncharacterized delta-60 repeat protein
MRLLRLAMGFALMLASIGLDPGAAGASSGQLDPGFGNGGKVFVSFGPGSGGARGVTLQSDGRVVLAGGNGGGFELVRLNPNGSPDATFGQHGQVTTPPPDLPFSVSEASSAVVQADGKVVAAGTAGDGTLGINNYFAVVRYNTDGSPDTGFGLLGEVDSHFGTNTSPAGSSASANAVVLEGSKILVGGSACTPACKFALARFNPDGSPDLGFGSNGQVVTDVGSLPDDSIAELVIDTTGDIVAAGGDAIVRYQPSGAVDPTFGSNGVARPTAGNFITGLALQGDGRIVVAGFSSQNHFFLARFTPAGTPDPTFGTAGQTTTAFGPSTDLAYSVGVEPGGNIVAVGFSCQVTECDFAIAEYRPDGSPDRSFGHQGQVLTPMANSEALAGTIQPDGKIIAAGGTSQFAIARYFN